MAAVRFSELIVAALLVTSFTVTGWLALWAAQSRANWFVRTVVFLAFIAPLLAVPANEAFATFALQALLIVLAVQVGRGHVTRRKKKATQAVAPEPEIPRATSFRFSILSMLQITAVVAAGSWIALRLPTLNSIAWINLTHIAVVAAIASLVGALLGTSRKPVVWLIAIGFCLLLGAGEAWFDWFAPAFMSDFGSWPPDPSGGLAASGLGVPERPIVAWFFIPPTIALLTALFVSLQTCAFPPMQPRNAPSQIAPLIAARTRRRARLALATLTFFVLAFPLGVLVKLLTPDPIPVTTYPNSNGHDDLVAAGNIALTTAFEGSGNFDYETATEQALAAEVGKCGAAYDLVAKGIAKQCRAPINYSTSSDGDLPMDDITLARTTARALAGKARLEELKGHFDDSARANVQTIQFGNSFRRGGMLIDALVGIACSEHGIKPLYKQRRNASPQQLDDCIAQLIRLDADDEPYADVWQRDRVWTQRAWGWHSHLQQILDDLAGNNVSEFFTSLRSHGYVYWSSQARLRLLICELALARYQQDNKHWPPSLGNLTPKYLPHVPIDPLSPTGDTLKYRLTGNGYVLYSLGPNCIDDKGTLPTSDDNSVAPESGDLRLDWVYGSHANASAKP